MNGLSTPPLQFRSNSLPSPNQQNSRRTTPSLGAVAPDSFNTRNVAEGLNFGGEGSTGSTDVWTIITTRVLPLFNNQGYQGYVEELNDLVRIHVQRTMNRAQVLARSRSKQIATKEDVNSLATGLIVGDLDELILRGCVTLAADLVNSYGDELLFKLNEVWTFFFTSVLPSLEAIFVFLRSEERLRGSTNDRSEGRFSEEEGRIDIRRLSLIGFRDNVILPRIDNLARLFQDLYTSNSQSSSSRSITPPPSEPTYSQPSSLSPTRTRLIPPLPPTTSNIPSPLSDSFSTSTLPSSSSPIPIPNSSTSSNFRISTPKLQDSLSKPIPSSNSPTENARRRHLLSILASALTDDNRQLEIDSLLSMMRLGPNSNSSTNDRRPIRSWTGDVDNSNVNLNDDSDGFGFVGTPFSDTSSNALAS